MSSAIVLFFLFGCNNNTDHYSSNVKGDTTQTAIQSEDSKDKQEIQSLIRKALNWSESKKTIDLLPTIEKDSIYVGFDLEKHKENLKKLKATHFFSAVFIENYNQIILTLDKKLRNNDYGTWHEGVLPEFGFADDVDPWCLCQDFPDDKSNPWTHVIVEVISINKDKSELYWKWGNLEPGAGAGWADAKYKFNAEKENGKWKITYMEGFDFNNAVK